MLRQTLQYSTVHSLNVWDKIQALVEVLDKQTIDFMLHLSCNFLGRGLSYVDVRHRLLVFDMIRHGSRSCLQKVPNKALLART